MHALVFVYGTLMRGQSNHGVMIELGARRMGEATTAAPRTLVDLGPYPALLPSGGPREERSASRVVGEIYEIDGAQVAALDAFEGCPALYRRERIAVEREGVTVEAWTYVLVSKPPRDAVAVTTGRYAGAGIVVRQGGADADNLDKSAEISDVSPPRRPR